MRQCSNSKNHVHSCIPNPGPKRLLAAVLLCVFWRDVLLILYVLFDFSFDFPCSKQDFCTLKTCTKKSIHTH